MHSKTTCIEPIATQTGGGDAVPTLEIVRFLIVTFVVGFALQLWATHAGLRHGGMGWLGLTMWAPTLGVVLAGPTARRMAWAATRRVGWRYLPVALLVGFGPRWIQTAWLALSGRGTWDREHFELAPDGRSIEGIHHLAMVLGVGPQSFSFFALNLALSITVGAMFVALIGGVGEEIGWRGFLQPTLERRFGRVRGTLVVGVIWAYWHVPANLAGYNDERHPLLGTLVVFPLIVVSMSFGFAWLRERSGSVWPPALAHGANNTLGAAFILEAKGWSSSTVLDLVSMALVTGWFIWRAIRNPASPGASVSRILPIRKTLLAPHPRSWGDSPPAVPEHRTHIAR